MFRSRHFEELKQTLDPDNVNPLIEKETFLNAMMSWTQKFKNQVDFNFNNEESSRFIFTYIINRNFIHSHLSFEILDNLLLQEI